MKKIVLVLVLLLAACGDVRDSVIHAETSPAQSGIGQVDPNRGKCLIGARIFPGVCQDNGNTFLLQVTTAGVCNSIDFAAVGLPASAAMVTLKVEFQLAALASPGQRKLQAVFYKNDNTCVTGLTNTASHWGYEYAGPTAGTVISDIEIPVSSIPIGSDRKVYIFVSELGATGSLKLVKFSLVNYSD